MANKRRRRKNNSNLTLVCFLLVWLVILGIVFMVAYLRDNAPIKGEDTESESVSDSVVETEGESETETDAESETVTETETVIIEPDPVTYSEATVISVGDLIFHMAQINYANAVGDGVHDFTNSFNNVAKVRLKIPFLTV